MIGSFVIPVYNQVPDYLEQAIKSVSLTLKDLPFEVIICDDGSDLHLSMEYRIICEKLNSIYIKLNKNCGMNVSRNIASLRARGEFIILLDSDDVLSGDWRSFLQIASRLKPVVAFGDHVQCNETFDEILQNRVKEAYFRTFDRFHGTIFDPFLHCTFLFHPQVYRRDKFLEAGGFDCSFSSGDEIALQLKLLRDMPQHALMYSDIKLYKYRKNPKSVVHNAALYKALIKNIETIIELEFIKRHGMEVEASWLGRERQFGAAHYAIRRLDDGSFLDVPWFDQSTMSITTK